MKNISAILNKYRDCSRHLWNAFFMQNFTSIKESHDILDLYEEIDKNLFSALVLNKLGKMKYKKDLGVNPLPFIKVVPKQYPEVPIMINRPVKGLNKYWDDPVNRVSADGIELEFIEYFDFDKYGFVDFSYYHVRISSFPKHPNLVGREALIEVIHADVFYKNQGKEN